HPVGDAGVAGGGAAHRPPYRRPRHPRRRGGALPLRPRRRAIGPPRSDRRRIQHAFVSSRAAGCSRYRRRVHRHARKGPAVAAGGIAMRRWVLPALLLAALIGAWQVAASTGALEDALNLQSFLVP